MNEFQIKLLNELYSYAEDIRMDWSGFDGRDLLRFVSDWIKRFNESEMKRCTYHDEEQPLGMCLSGSIEHSEYCYSCIYYKLSGVKEKKE